MTGFSTIEPISMTGSLLFGRFGYPATGAGQGRTGGVEPFRHRRVGQPRLLRLRLAFAKVSGMFRITGIARIVQFAVACSAYPAESVVEEIVEIDH